MVATAPAADAQDLQQTPHELADKILSQEPPKYKFNFDPFLRSTYRLGISPDAPQCKLFFAGHCPLGASCPDRHALASHQSATYSHSSYNNLVCKHWLRGLCKKGDHCEFLHEYNLRKMPECNFFSRNGFCSNGDECLYLHIDEKSRRMKCEWFERGFCPLGPRCAKRHVKQTLCPFYLAGFCPDGRHCREGAHARWSSDKDMPKPEIHVERDPEEVAAEIEAKRQEAERMEAEERERFQERTGGRGGRGGRWAGRGFGGGDVRRQRGRGHLH